MAVLVFYSSATSVGLCTILPSTTYGSFATGGGVTQSVASQNVGDLAGLGATFSGSEVVKARHVMKADTALASWQSGTYAVDITVDSANMNLTLQSVHVVRIDSTCTAGSAVNIGSTSGLGVNLGSTGPLATINVTGSSNSGSATDRLLVALVIDNGSMSAQACTLRWTVTTPIEPPAAFLAPPPKVISTAVRRASQR